MLQTTHIGTWLNFYSWGSRTTLLKFGSQHGFNAFHTNVQKCIYSPRKHHIINLLREVFLVMC